MTDKMESDVTRLIESKKPKENAPEISPAVTEKDEQKSNIYPTIDGHMVKSSMEQAIDDILWNAGILHAYEQPITEFVYERKKCDWFIPIIGSEQGIYIEYWGMKTQKYLNRFRAFARSFPSKVSSMMLSGVMCAASSYIFDSVTV